MQRNCGSRSMGFVRFRFIASEDRSCAFGEERADARPEQCALCSAGVDTEFADI